METQKLLDIIALYERLLRLEGIRAQRMDPSRYFGDLSREELLAHALHLCEGLKTLAIVPAMREKAMRHLGSLQTILGFARWYTLDDLRAHNF